MALRELLFWAHNIVELATRRKPMVLPRFEDLEIEQARLVAGGTASSKGISFPLRDRLVTDGGPDAWGTTLWLPGVKEPLLGSGRWRIEDVGSGKTRLQAWREGWSVILTVLVFLPQMQGGAILHYSECSCVVNLVRRLSQHRYFAGTGP